jgi:hypothetical protein
MMAATNTTMATHTNHSGTAMSVSIIRNFMSRPDYRLKKARRSAPSALAIIR